jgi:hypothetical protein
MKKRYLRVSCFSILGAVLMLFGSQVYAGDAQFDELIQSTHVHRAQMEAQLGLVPQVVSWRAVSYYDDLEDHYELSQFTRDAIEGIR